MNTAAAPSFVIPHDRLDRARGTHAMVWFIASETVLFLMLFFSYFYLWHFSTSRWVTDPPKVAPALLMLVILITSSGILRWGERAVRRGRESMGRVALAITILFGLAFLAVQAMEYQDRLRTVRPTDDAYGSMFYVITGMHGAHVTLGLLMLAYVLILPGIGANDRPPHHPMKNAAMYWHFVDAVWIVIVAILYLLPRIS